MGRFSPTVLPDPGPSWEDLLAQAFMAIDRKRARDEDTRRQERLDTEREADRARAAEDREIRLHERGYRKGTAPTKPSTLDVGSEGPIKVPAFDPQLGMQRGRGENPLADALGGFPEEETGATIAALPGQFIPELGTFTPRAILKVAPPRLRMPREETPTPQVTDPRYEQVTEGRYLDTEATPAARAGAAARAEDQAAYARDRSETFAQERMAEGERTALYDALEALDNVSAEQANALSRGAPASVVMPRQPASSSADDRLAYQKAENAARGSARGWLATGIDPQTTALFVQEQNPELDRRDALRITYEVYDELHKDDEGTDAARALDFLDIGGDASGIAEVGGDRPTLQDRIAELKRRGVGREEAYRILRQEGYIQEEQP